MGIGQGNGFYASKHCSILLSCVGALRYPSSQPSGAGALELFFRSVSNVSDPRTTYQKVLTPKVWVQLLAPFRVRVPTLLRVQGGTRCRSRAQPRTQ